MDAKHRISERAMELLEEVVGDWKLSYAEGGPMTKGMEAQFERVQHCEGLTVVNCTIGMEMVFRALHLKGRKILVPANGMSADPLAVMNSGAAPVFGDVDPAWGTLTAAEVRMARKIHPDLAGVLYIHIGGVSPDYSEVAEACQDLGLLMVEDCAHVMGNLLAGSKGVAAVYSMFATKVLPAAEGGIVSGEKWVLDEVRMMRMCGRPSEWGNATCQGTNGKMSELNAAFGLAALENAERLIGRRLAACAVYGLAELKGKFSRPGYKFMMTVHSEEKRAALASSRAVSGKVFAVPLPDQPAFAHCPTTKGTMDGAAMFCREHVCLKTDVDVEMAKVLAAEVAEILRVK